MLQGTNQLQTKCFVDEVGRQKWVKVQGGETMVGTRSNGFRSRQAFSILNGGQDRVMAGAMASAPASTAGSESGGTEFTREDVEALVNERMKTKNKFNYKERCDQMMDYIKRLRICIRWFQELEGAYLMEQDQLRDLLESAEKKCEEMEAMIENKEEEFNAIIMELRKNYDLLQEKCAKEESDKLVLMDSLSREKEAMISAQKTNASLSKQLRRTEEELVAANQRIASNNEVYRKLQDYNASLQHYNTKLQTELGSANEILKRVEREKAAVVEELSSSRGLNNSLYDQLSSSKDALAEANKQKEALANEIGSRRMELQQVRDDRERQSSQIQALTDEVDNHKECTRKLASELDDLSLRSNELEGRCLSQNEVIWGLQDELTVAQKKIQMHDSTIVEGTLESEGRKKAIQDLQNRLAEAEAKLVEGENLRKKLHNTILELKGNIRVFCRVRPFLPEEATTAETKAITYPTSTEAMGRGIDVSQDGQKHAFLFDKVFKPEASQDEVFVEISQLIQSALDGYKVCIFSYGQTGSGKTFTMMGEPGNPEEKGLIPRSVEQIFETREALWSQGWKYDLQVSMLEIYNETIRDLLSTSKHSYDPSRLENSNGKQYTIKHDADGNTQVSDLTTVDVHSSHEVSYLLDKAAQSRAVGKTLMNEQSSRSHFVFTLRISGVNECTEQQVQGILNLIDLAGSERLSKSGSTGDRLKETQAINKSLSSLSDVIFALAKKEDHVPFRNSKLTYLLQPCLGGASKTLMFVNLSPDPSSLGETLRSLKFAARVNACEIGAPRRQTYMRTLESRLSYG
ncbi:Kinesin-like protein [Drosera capensis]